MSHCQLALKDRVLTVTIDRPPVNALSRDVLAEMADLLTKYRESPEVGALVLTGAGDKVFSGGADITEFGDLADPEKAKETLARMHRLFNQIETYPKPIIACLNGTALGGANELQMACHLAIAADTAELGLPEVRLGIIPGYGGTQRLTRLIGRRRALELILSGEKIPASLAREYGLVNRVVPGERVREEAFQWARRLAAGPPLAVHGILDAVIRGGDGGLADGLAIEQEHLLKVIGSEDAREGITAFFEKRPPVFKGR
ncbi:enoyl-CoA hydratase/isomerase family protein [Camelliibacillus cellulosilyticus]|uniref:Enoyl-CoA hydratase/isomerase family protein n=1 Tax=Camelliibacillus cellulosilyticus TaxID=2174486 RepID=A0ABV9GQ67_9BACL